MNPLRNSFLQLGRGAAIGVFACVIVSAQTFHQGLNSDSFEVNEPRPVAKAAQLLEEQYGIQINYEEPPVVFRGDLDDQVSPEFAAAHPGAHAFVPKSGRLVWTNEVAGMRRTLVSPTDILQNLIGQHRANGNPGIFQLKEMGNVFFITPFQGKDENGAIVSRSSPLDSRISISAESRNGIVAFQAICSAITESSGIKVEAGYTLIQQLFRQSTVSLEANDEPARDVLLRMFGGLERRGSKIQTPARQIGWRLFYDPDNPGYVLNLHIAVGSVSTPFGPNVRKP